MYPSIGLARDSQNSVPTWRNSRQRGKEKRRAKYRQGVFWIFFAIGTPPDEIYCSILAEWEQGGVYGRKSDKTWQGLSPRVHLYYRGYRKGEWEMVVLTENAVFISKLVISFALYLSLIHICKIIDSYLIWLNVLWRAGASPPCPVSYTHLDVYKRQGQER